MCPHHSKCAHTSGTSWLQLLCSHHFFTVSVTVSAISSPCPSPLHCALTQGQLRVWQTWPCQAHVLLWHSQGRRAAQDQAIPPGSLLPCTRGTALSCSLHGNRAPGGFCVALASQWRELWNLLERAVQLGALPPVGAPGATPPQGHSPQLYSELLREAQHTLHA